MYSRLVHALPDGNLLISAGLKEWETHVFDVKTLHFRQVFEPGDYAEKVTDDLVLTTGKNGYRFYDVQPLNLWCRI